MRNIHLLQIAVNDYHPESPSSLRNLHGCINDITSLHDVLTTLFPAQLQSGSVQQLINSEAKYHKVISAIKNLAAKAKPGDTVFIQYSGHGSKCMSAIEFRENIHQVAWDNSLVLYDSRTQDGFDLADKEIKALFSTFHKEVELLFLADSCHAGDMTRGTELVPRLSEYITTPRPLNTYLDGYYTQYPLHVEPKHNIISLGAADAEESAYELDGKGVFTATLCDILKESKGNITYEELFEQSRIRIAKMYKEKQTPQFSMSGKLNSDQYFLNDIVKTTDTSMVYFDMSAGVWKFMLGQVHGLQQDDVMQVEIHLDNHEQYDTPRLAIQEVMMDYCTLEHFEKGNIHKTYLGIVDKPANDNISFAIHGDLYAFSHLKAQLEQQKPRLNIKNTEDTKYIISCSMQQNVIGESNFQTMVLLRHNQKVLHSVSGVSSQEVTNMLIDEALLPIDKWERLKAIEHKGNLGEQIEWYLEGYDKDENDIRLLYAGEDIPFAFKAKNNSDMNVYFLLLQMTRKYEIKPRKYEGMISPGGEATLYRNYFLIGDDSPEARSIFKLIASTSPLDAHTFEIDTELNFGVEDIRKCAELEKRGDTRESEIVEEWYASNKSVLLVRKSKASG